MIAMGNWRDQVFAYFEVPGAATNAPTEALNGVVKLAIRLGRGYPFEAIRAKIAKILHGMTPRTRASASLRTQTPAPKLMQCSDPRHRIGGYQVAEKWLKDRKGRTLSYDDIARYQRTLAALAETAALMERVDGVIEEAGGWPLG